MKTKLASITIAITLLISSCATTKLPKYVPMEKVYQLKIGMSLSEITSLFDQNYHDIKSIDKDGNMTVIFKYRVTVRKVDPNFIEPTNGIATTGKWDNLTLTFDNQKKLVAVKGSELNEVVVPIIKKK